MAEHDEHDDARREDAATPEAPGPTTPTAEPVLGSELLVEEVSIDGLCGVY